MESPAVASMSSPVAMLQKTQAVIPHQKFEGHTECVTNVIHLRGGRQIMTCSFDGSMRVWNVRSGKQIGEYRKDERAEVNTIALSPDGKKVASGSTDGAVRLWDIETPKVIAKWMGHAEEVVSLCWSRDGRRVVSGSYDGIRVWDVETGETILGPLQLTNMNAAAYSPDETMIATGGRHSDIGFIKIFDRNTGKLVKNLEPTGIVCSLAWPEDGKTLISGSNNKIKIWNTTTWHQIAVLTEHSGVVRDIAVSPNGRILASASREDTRLWNLENGQPISSPLQSGTSVDHVSFSTDGKVLATGCCDGNAYTWDVSAIVKEAGLDELLSNAHDVHKSLLDDDATRRQAQRLRNTHRAPPGFFDDSPHHPASSGRCRPLLPSARQYQTASGLASRGRTFFSSLFRPIDHDSHEAPPEPPLDQSGSLSSRLQQRSPSVTDVPLAQGQRRNASAGEVRWKREKEKKAFAGGSRLLQSNVTQQSGAALQTQPSSQSNAAVSTLSTTPAVAATSVPDITIRQAGHWTRFWLRFCCAPAEYADGQH